MNPIDDGFRAIVRETIQLFLGSDLFSEKLAEAVARASAPRPFAPSPPAVELLTVEAVAQRCSVSKETVRNWIHAGTLVGQRTGRRLMVRPSELQLFLARGAVSTFEPAPSIDDQVADLMAHRNRGANK